MGRSYFIKAFLFFLFPLLFVAQELPPIENFSPEIYDAGNQNWMISQSKGRDIFIANNSGLLQYNGAKWRLNASPNGSVIRSVKVIGDLVYTGCYMDFGFWKQDLFGDLIYTSLISKLDQKLVEDEQFWNIQDFGDWILFQSLDRIYLYNTKKESFTIVEAKTSRANIFIEKNSVYFQKVNEGIFKIEKGKSVLVSSDAVARENNLIGVFLVKENVKFLFDNGTFYELFNNKLKKWKIPADAELSDKKIYCGLQLRDNSIVLGTISNGVYLINPDGAIIERINRNHGLQDNTILSIFEDEENNLWLGLDNGITVLNLKSHFSIYTDTEGEVGVVYASQIHKDMLYLGTNQGLFYKPLKSQDKFQLVGGTGGQVWSLNKIDGTLFCGHHEGTFVIERTVARKISDFPGTWAVKKIPFDQNLLLQGNYEGLSILEKSNGQWKYRNKIEGIDIPVRLFELVKDHQIIINHDQKGVFILDVDKGYEEILNIKEIPSYGYGSSLVKFNNDVIYTTNLSREVYKFNGKTKEFTIDSVLTNTFYKEGEGLIGTLISDQESKKLWGFSNKNAICVFQGKFGKEFQVINVSVTSAFRRGFGLEGFENLTYVGDEIFLIGASNGYLYLDLNKIAQNKHQIRIDAIENESIDGFSQKISKTGEHSFNFYENNFKISYSISHYDKYLDVEYQYQLIGLSDQWHSWSDESQIALNNLSFGSYKLNIRSRIGSQISLNTESFTFEIKKPWYFTNVSIAVYAFVFLLISFAIHKVYKSHYTKKQKREIKKAQRKLKIENLKNEKELILVRNENLRFDIENKNRELGISTMSLIKKNEFLNSIKKELKKIKDDHNSLKHVIRVIDKNLNNEDDWNVFEKAFNNVDKEFLKIIKKLHPELTSNDLRLCTYLRLNLSSKEIAPLFNISSKSVEVKRYRLRKKMGLSHESNLTDYILEI